MPAILHGGFPLPATPKRCQHGSIYSWEFVGIPLARNPQSLKKGHLFNVMMRTMKILSNVPVGFPEYGMTSASIFGGVFPG